MRASSPLLGFLGLTVGLLWMLSACPSTTSNVTDNETTSTTADASTASAPDTGAAPTPVAPSVSKNPEELFNEGVQLAQSNQFSSALTKFQEATKQKASLYQAWYNIGVINQRLNNTTESQQAYEKALEIKPDFYEAAINLSRLYLAQRRTSQALSLLEQKANQFPTDLRFRNAVIYLYIHQGQLGRSEQMALAIQKKDEKNAHAIMNLGLVWYKQGKYELARMAFTIASRNRRDDATPQYYLGFTQMKLKNTTEAIDAFQKAVKLQPSYPEAHNALGVALMKNSKLTEAIHHFQEATKYMPRFWEAQLNLGIALFKNQQSQAALNRFLVISRINPYYSPTYYYLGILYLDHNFSQGRLQPGQFLRQVPSSLQQEKVIFRTGEKIARYATAIQHFRTYMSRTPNLDSEAPVRKYLEDAIKKQARAEKDLQGTIKRLLKRRLRRPKPRPTATQPPKARP